MKKFFKLSLNQRLAAISIAAILPMMILLSYILWELTDATTAYADINRNVSYANQYARDFKERIDYTMYLAVIRSQGINELDVGTTTINGIVTVNPYSYIYELEKACDELSDMATVNSSKNQISRLKNTLGSLKKAVRNLEESIVGEGNYEDNMKILDKDIYNLTALIEEGIQDYIYLETSNFDVVEEDLNKQKEHTIRVCLVTTIVVIMLAIALTVYAAKSVTVPIRKLCDVTSKVAEGDFTVKTKVMAEDEIAVLTRNFNDMTKEIGILIEDMKRQQENLHMIEMQLLQAQINPHFLYNTLDTIVWLAEAKQTEEVVAMVTYLSDFFRTTLSKGKDFITVEEEKLHIESYLKIQHFRYQDTMDYEIAIDEELYEFTIPKLMLQPLIENAICHGIRNKRGKGHIQITGAIDDGEIVFQVIDNGCGMSTDELQKLRNSIEKNESYSAKDGGFGIVNVNQRIHAYYGENYGVFFESEAGEGTTARVHIGCKLNVK